MITIPMTTQNYTKLKAEESPIASCVFGYAIQSELALKQFSCRYVYIIYDSNIRKMIESFYKVKRSACMCKRLSSD